MFLVRPKETTGINSDHQEIQPFLSRNDRSKYGVNYGVNVTMVRTTSGLDPISAVALSD